MNHIITMRFDQQFGTTFAGTERKPARAIFAQTTLGYHVHASKPL